jgi:hypothetical protein
MKLMMIKKIGQTQKVRNLIKFICKNIDYALTCVFRDLEEDSDHKNQAFLLGLIILHIVKKSIMMVSYKFKKRTCIYQMAQQDKKKQA